MNDDLHREQWTELSKIDKEPPTVSADPAATNSTVGPAPTNLTPNTPADQFLPDPKQGKSAAGFALTTGLFQLIVVAGIVLIFAWLIQQANSGVSGTEFIGLFVIVLGVPLAVVAAVLNAVTLAVWFVRRRPTGVRMILPILSGALSALLIVYGAYTAYSWFVVAPTEYAQNEREFDEEMRKADEGFYNEEITVEKTKELLRSCQLFGFYYTAQADAKYTQDGTWAESSTTGVVLTYVDSKPARVGIADRLIPELVPVAREAQKTCPDLQFWHDGSYEQKRADGTWE